MHIHILGICGTFMGGLAAIAREAGHRVTGCDASVYPPMSDQLRALGIELIEGYGAEQIALKPDVFVIGNVVTRAKAQAFPLFEAILDGSLPGWVMSSKPASPGCSHSIGRVYCVDVDATVATLMKVGAQETTVVFTAFAEQAHDIASLGLRVAGLLPMTRD